MRKIFLLVLISISISVAQNEIQEIVSQIQKKYAPDKRTAIFSVSVIEENSFIILKGEVDNAEAKKELLDQVTASKKIIDSIIVLPHAQLGEQLFGIVVVSVANMRTEPAEPAELTSQVLMGNVVRLWKKRGGYVFAQSPEKYLGWVDPDQLQLVSEKEALQWTNSKMLFVTAVFDFIREKPDVNAMPVCDIVGGAIVKNLGKKGNWYNVALADGRRGFVQSASVVDYTDWGKKISPQPDAIEKTGRYLLGVPYLWGGTSVKGIDCSGFTKTVFLLNGMMLNRDANQQAEQGVHIEPGAQFEHLKKGDLLFFGRKADIGKPERITHVGIYLGERMYIHSSSKVRLNSFDEHSPQFDEFNLRRFVRARRVIPSLSTVKEINIQ